MDEKQMKMAEELLFSGKQLPSFAKALYFGDFEGERAFPFPTISKSEQKQSKAFLKTLRTFLDENVDPDTIDRKADIPKKVIKGMGDIGLLGLTVPEEYGGQGASQYVYCHALEEVARRCGSTALFVNAHQSIGIKAILMYGTDKHRKAWLKKLATGRAVSAFSLTEPNAGSDAAGVETRAVYDAEKKVYRINGQKQWTTNGSIANVLTVMAQTKVGKEDKITAFLVPSNTPGFEVLDPALEKVGMRGSKTANLKFTDMEVPEENILGKKGEGLKIALNTLNYGRTTFGATCTGTAKELLERAIVHATERHQFKRPLASFALVKEKISKMSALVYAMDATTYLTAGLVDQGQTDVMLETAILKVFASEAQWSVLYDTMQILGGRSFFTDQPYERMMRDARLNSIGEGSNEVLRAFIGVVGMRDVGLALQAGTEAFKHPFSRFSTMWKFSSQMLGRVISTPTIPVKSKHIQKEANLLARHVRKFGMAIPKLLGKYREGIVEKQMVLDRIAESAISLYTTTAVLSKLDRALGEVNDKAPSLGNDVDVAKLYCRMAFENLENSLGSLFKNQDGAIEALSDQITGVKAKW